MPAELKNSIKRYIPEPDFGLSYEQVLSRKEADLVNKDTSIPTKTIPQIIKDNTFTLFNILNFVLAAAIIYVGSFKNLLFMGVVVSNLIISTYQEIRAKRAVDKLSILSLNKVTVIREGKRCQINIDELVLDDIIELSQGSQIPADCKIICGQISVNESLLTGESDSIDKKVGDLLLSGSFVVSGKCKAKIEHVGQDNYASKISSDAKYVKKSNSQIMAAFNRIILILSILIVPIGAMLFMRQLSHNSLENAVVNTTAALIGMIPEGLVLLTSTVLAVGVIRLTKKKVLVQDLYCIETLARVDTLCLDKTGTITQGTMQVEDVIPHKGVSQSDVRAGLAMIVNNTDDSNPTYHAIKDFVDENKAPHKKASTVVPFSSEKKWSGVYVEGHGAYVMGAAEFILRDKCDSIKDQLQQLTKENRVVILAHSKENFIGKELPMNLELMGFVLIRDVIRETAAETLKYFYDEGVDVKIISGDNVSTVSNIARRVGVKGHDKCVDASTLRTKDDLRMAAREYNIFGRVSPTQKKEIICALKEQGHTVAMTGDGVNDVLALKEADCSVVMANGSDAARNVSQLVLLNSDFASMPKVVLEGRRSINNIQRSSSLFLIKTIYSTLLAILFLFFHTPYPFMPIQMTLINMFTIGIPSFVLALEPNNSRIDGNLFFNIIKKALPCALTIVMSILSVTATSKIVPLTDVEMSTLCVILTGLNGFLLLFKLCTPFNLTRKILFSVMSAAFAISILLFRGFFSLAAPSFKLILVGGALCTLSWYTLNYLSRLAKALVKNRRSAPSEHFPLG